MSLNHPPRSGPATIHAVRFHAFGPPDVLQVERVPAPRPGRGEVLVAVAAASVGGGETSIRAGRMRWLLPARPPMGIGVDFAGEVLEVGDDVDRVVPGDAVWGLMPHLRFGSSAEQVVVPAVRVGLAPGSLTPVQAAALPVVGTTVLTALRDKAGLAAGERLLVRGGSGGVGSLAVQLGRHLGAHVTALAGARNLDWLTELGADEAFDHRATDTDDLGRFDVILDAVGVRWAPYLGLLRPGGRFLPLAVDPDRPIRAAAGVVWRKAVAPSRVLPFSNDPTPEVLDELAALVSDGALRPVVDSVLPMTQAVQAHRRVEVGGLRGKVVLTTR